MRSSLPNPPILFSFLHWQFSDYADNIAVSSEATKQPNYCPLEVLLPHSQRKEAEPSALVGDLDSRLSLPFSLPWNYNL